MTAPDRGAATQSTDPLGQTVNSEYDSLCKLTKTSTLLSNQEVKTEHTYDSQTGYLTGTSHNTDGDCTHSVVYHFGYDSLGRQTSVSVGSSVLSTTYYDALRRMVNRIVFGNGGQVRREIAVGNVPKFSHHLSTVAELPNIDEIPIALLK